VLANATVPVATWVNCRRLSLMAMPSVLVFALVEPRPRALGYDAGPGAMQERRQARKDR
jgi:hypothetical protein